MSKICPIMSTGAVDEPTKPRTAALAEVYCVGSRCALWFTLATDRNSWSPAILRPPNVQVGAHAGLATTTRIPTGPIQPTRPRPTPMPDAKPTLREYRRGDPSRHTNATQRAAEIAQWYASRAPMPRDTRCRCHGPIPDRRYVAGWKCRRCGRIIGEGR